MLPLQKASAIRPIQTSSESGAWFLPNTELYGGKELISIHTTSDVKNSWRDAAVYKGSQEDQDRFFEEVVCKQVFRRGSVPDRTNLGMLSSMFFGCSAAGAGASSSSTTSGNVNGKPKQPMPSPVNANRKASSMSKALLAPEVD